MYLLLTFIADAPATVYCKIELDEEKLKAFVYAVKNRYWYQMFVDDLPVWGEFDYMFPVYQNCIADSLFQISQFAKIICLGVVGEADDSKNEYHIFTHKKFNIGFNGKQIVDVNMTTEGRVLLTRGAEISFSYEVNWLQSNTKYEDRFDKYLDPNFFQHRIHWFSIFNSFMMVIFLVGLVSMILMRTLRKDYARYSKDEEMDDMVWVCK